AKPKEKKGPSRYELGETLDNELADLSEGYRGAPVTQLVREAVEEFIARCLDDEPAVRRRYETARKKRLEQKNTNLTVIGKDND
ncbi:MAG TPA: hypothetical protein QF556_04245, partial [Rhodospirillales bacterium]|nr:hypothetical protein [Rhodospirillales bacterium]